MKPEYKKLSKMYDKAVVSWNDEIENRVCQNGNSKGFYKYANKKLQIFNSVPPLKSSSGDVATTDKEKADLLNRTFYEQFVKDDNIKLNLPKRAELKSEISSIFVDDDIIREALNHLSAKTSETPDGVPSFVLKKIGSAITPFLSMFLILVFRVAVYRGSGRLLTLRHATKKVIKTVRIIGDLLLKPLHFVVC